MCPQAIGDHMGKRRLELGFDQQQVADKIDVSRERVCNWERGIYRPTKRAMPGIIGFLGYDPRTKNNDSNT
jgi:transcriptional regulator with XRE-family HTH domain